MLDEALADKAVKNIPILKETDSTDPKVDLRKKLLVTIIPGTYLIRVSYNSNDRNEAYAVVNAVVDAFIQPTSRIQSRRYGVVEGAVSKDSSRHKKKNWKKKAELMKLAAKGNVEFPKPKIKPKADDDETPQPSFEKLSIDQYTQTNDKLLQTEMDLMDLRSLLQARLAESQGEFGTLAKRDRQADA